MEELKVPGHITAQDGYALIAGGMSLLKLASSLPNETRASRLLTTVATELRQVGLEVADSAEDPLLRSIETRPG